MARQVLALVLAIALTTAPVHGGSQAWESSIGQRVEALKYPVPLVGENATMVGESRPATHVNQKRYLTFKPGTGNADTRLWPDRTIKYCFEDKTWPTKEGKTTKLILDDFFKDAKNLWYQAGLPESFRWEEMDAKVCADVNRRSEFSLIKYNTDGKLGTPVGIPPNIGGPNPRVGTYMKLSDSEEVGMLNVVSNIAHEMGHAWGLHHEHQNQAFWTQPYSQSGGTLFGASNWNCQNLKDYNTIVDEQIDKFKISQGEAEKKRDVACNKRKAAEALKFSAFDYLPITDEQVLASKKDIDWDSIMIYPSGSGGSGTAINGNDQRAPILLKGDGSRIPINLRPSARDIDGLKKLYAYKPSRSWTPLTDLRNSLKSKIDAILKKNPDSGCA